MEKLPNVGKLTPEQTTALLRECINALPEATLFQVLNEALTVNQKEKLGESWFNIDREGF